MAMRLTGAAAVAVAVFFMGASGIAVAPLAAQEPEPSKTLTPGKGSDLTMAKCAICHDAEHITRARLSRGEWEFNIKNMIERGAPITADEIPLILDYLAAYYNRDSAPPAPDPAAAGGGSGQDPVQRLLTANACTACHGVDNRIVGPSFREIAARYAGDSDAPARLAAKIRQGGAGAWGQVPMPPHPAMADADLREITAWILSRN